jgi:hypothetical protein
MSYKGFFKPTNRAKYKGNANNVVFRSMWERHCFVWLDNNPDVVSWSSEEVVVPYYSPIDKKMRRYFVDLKYTTKTGQTFIIEVKPAKETKVPDGPKNSDKYIRESITYVKNQSKWEAADKYARDNGWVFDVWTENELYKLGIMTRPLPKASKLKPLKPLKVKKR